MSKLVVARRYRGPSQSGNGGYVCGLVAASLDPASAAEVTLRAPLPLDTPMCLCGDAEGASLFHERAEIATARTVRLDLTPPLPMSVRDANAASQRFAGFQDHPYPECFVCGPRRMVGDGLCIFPGPTDDGQRVGAVWTPSRRDVDGEGRVRAEMVWAALDCPGYFALRRPGLPALLGRMTAQIYDRPMADEPAVAIGWPLGQDGRRHQAASALYSASGAVLALARTTWIEVT